jgi:hypothetical protein
MKNYLFASCMKLCQVTELLMGKDDTKGYHHKRFNLEKALVITSKTA